MKKVTFGLIVAAGVALAMPANAQEVWVGAGPVGVGFGAGPYTYGAGPYWGSSYTYAPGYAYEYGSAPSYGYGARYGYAAGSAYNYGPGYNVSYGFGSPYGYSYAPSYTYGSTYAAPAYGYSSYSYESQPTYSRRIVRIRSSHPVSTTHVGYRSARIPGEAYQAQASVPVRHFVRHSRAMRLDRDNTSVPGQGVLKDDVTPLR